MRIQRLSPESLAYLTALLVNFVDSMGVRFAAPVIVPYGRWIGASVSTIATFATAQGICLILANFWMPKLSDARGRKVVIFISLVGSAVGYAFQGIAWRISGLEVLSFMIGQGLAGLFGGTATVVRAYIAELSLGDAALLKRRMTGLLVANQAAGVVLGPIAGSLASLHLPLPFWICSGTALVGLLWACINFQEVKDIRAATEAAATRERPVCAIDRDIGTSDLGILPVTSSDAALEALQGNESTHSLRTDPPAHPPGGSQSGSDSAAESETDFEGSDDSGSSPLCSKVASSPWCDKVVLLFFTAYMFLFTTVAGYMLLLPLMLRDPVFGLMTVQVPLSGDLALLDLARLENEAQEEESAVGENAEGNIAKAVGLLAMPQGLLNLFFSMFVFLPLTSRVGETVPLLISGAGWAGVYIAYGFCSQLWQVALLNAVSGMCLGIIVPAIGPLLSQYASAHYANRLANTMAVPLMGMYLAQAFGQQTMALVYTHCGLQAAWIASAVCIIISVVLIVLLLYLVAAQSPTPDKSKRRSLLEADADDFEKYVDSLLSELRAFLLKNRHALWSWPMQHVVWDRVTNLVPKVREWNDESHGQEYIEDLSALLLPYREQLHRFEEQFPDLRQRRLQEEELDGVSVAGTRSIVSNSPNERLRWQVSSRISVRTE
ncbi:unnamed protein product [Prorocentrum cordatum]|uniref:Major facilitator superfamily (MFS) profile domain-containing protein n=1 Tax=Prorocentrum cordatum TaxID=2364126 RepID=A0ABN9RN70_9DINO|nr:unnamed protein product [Polarella glacialis]